MKNGDNYLIWLHERLKMAEKDQKTGGFWSALYSGYQNYHEIGPKLHLDWLESFIREAKKESKEYPDSDYTRSFLQGLQMMREAYIENDWLSEASQLSD